MKKVLVTGASGFIGSNLVSALSKDFDVRCMVRESSKVGHLPDSCEIVRGDMKDKDSLIEATKGVSVVFHLAASTSQKASAADESEKVNVQGARDLVEACEANGVSRLIVVSSQSTKREKQGNYGRTKMLADEIFMKSSLQWTILKPTLVYGPGSKGLFAKIFGLITKLPVIPIIGKGDYELQPTYIDDLVAAMVACVGNEKTVGKTYDIAGKSRVKFTELISTINRVMRNEKKMVHVPYGLCYAGIKGLSYVTSNPPVTTDNLLGLMQETTIDLGPAEEDFNFNPITLEEGLKRTVWGEKPSSEVLKVGIIGLGKMGLLHASIVNHLPDAKIVALFDVNSKVRKYIYSMNVVAPFFTDLDEFLEQDLDAVFISVPPAFTASTIAKCSAKGIHIFVEKPLASTLDQAQSIVDSTKSVKTSVGYMYAYKPLVAKLKEMIENGKYGKVVSFDASAFVTQVLKEKKGWRYAKGTAGGGCVSLHGTHLLYLLYYLFGVPSKVTGTLYFPHSEVEDKAFAVLDYDDVKGGVKVSWSELGYPKLTLGLKVICEKGVLELFENRIEVDGEIVVSREDLANSEFELGGEGYYEQDKDFLLSIKNGHDSRVTVSDAFEIQRMVDAIYKSHSLKKEVEL